MPRLAATTTTTAALAVALLALNLIALGPALASCEWSWCTDSGPKRTYLTDTRRNILGDLYAPSSDRRVQIRDKKRNILGYIEPSGRITDTKRNIILKAD